MSYVFFLSFFFFCKIVSLAIEPLVDSLFLSICWNCPPTASEVLGFWWETSYYVYWWHFTHDHLLLSRLSVFDFRDFCLWCIHVLEFTLLGVCWAAQMCRSMYLIKFGRFLAFSHTHPTRGYSCGTSFALGIWKGICDTQLGKGVHLGLPLGVCRPEWWRAARFSAAFGWNRVSIVWMFPVLLGCSFPGSLARESRLLGSPFLSALGCRLLCH